MAVKTYNIINDTTDTCENVILWDSAAQPSWTPPAGTTEVEQKPAYSTGTGAASVTNGSVNVSITGATLQTDGVEVGRRIRFSGTGDSVTEYVIASITSETALTLDANYDGTTVTNADYIISAISIGDVIP